MENLLFKPLVNNQSKNTIVEISSTLTISEHFNILNCKHYSLVRSFLIENKPETMEHRILRSQNIKVYLMKIVSHFNGYFMVSDIFQWCSNKMENDGLPENY